MKHATATFAITGDFITRQARAFWWDEEERAKALDLLACLDGLGLERAVDVIFGKAKLVGDSTIGITLEPDSADRSPSGNPIQGNLIEVLLKEEKRVRILEDDLADVFAINKPRIASPYGLVELGPHALRRYKKGEETLESLERRGLLRKIEPVLLTRGALARSVQASDAQPDTEPEASDKKEPPPKPDFTLTARNGWMDREGRLYPCAYMEHIRLAEQLGYAEGRLEEMGWVKISDYATAPAPVPPRPVAFYVAKIRPTDEQIKATAQWCEKHGYKLPFWCGGDDPLH